MKSNSILNQLIRILHIISCPSISFNIISKPVIKILIFSINSPINNNKISKKGRSTHRPPPFNRQARWLQWLPEEWVFLLISRYPINIRVDFPPHFIIIEVHFSPYNINIVLDLYTAVAWPVHPPHLFTVIFVMPLQFVFLPTVILGIVSVYFVVADALFSE